MKSASEVCDGTDLGCKVCRRIAIEDAIRKSKDLNLRSWDELEEAARLAGREKL